MTIREFVPDNSVRTVYNGTGSTIPIGRGVRRSGSTNIDQVALPAATPSLNPRFGVTKESIADGKYGGAQKFGVVKAEANAAIAAGAKVECSATGKFQTYTSGVIWGVANTATTADGEYFELDLDANGAVS